VTVDVVTVKVAEAAPEATVTLARVLAAALLEESATDAPPAGAAPVRVTVQVLEAPPSRLDGEQVRVCNPRADPSSEIEAEAVLPL
jgi:hypothetical protein